MFSCCMCNDKKSEKRNNINLDEVDDYYLKEKKLKNNIESPLKNTKSQLKIPLNDDKLSLKNDNDVEINDKLIVKIIDQITTITEENEEEKLENKKLAEIDDAKISKIVIENKILGPPDQSNLFQAPGYIERRIVDDIDENDSVFESSICDYQSTDDDVTMKVSCQVVEKRKMPRWLSEEDDDDDNPERLTGMKEPPATPVAKDELALRRHRFFSDLMQATKNTSEHRVRFDPLGPTIHNPGFGSDKEEHFEDLLNRLEKLTERLENIPNKLKTSNTQEIAIQTAVLSPKKIIAKENQVKIKVTNMSAVEGYNDIITGPLYEFLKLSVEIGGDVADHSKLVEQAFKIQQEFIRLTSTRPAPQNQSEQMSLLGPTSNQIQAIQSFREKNRGSAFFNHLSAISESIPALGWVAVSPTPAPYVKEMNDAGQFYTNRVLKDWKEKDKKHVEWCKAWIQTLSELQKYVRQHHTTGLVWAKTGSAPPPPPPPSSSSSFSSAIPPPPPCMPVGDISTSISDDRSALFAQINQGENITKSLKKVTSDMQTHKNSSLRTGPAPFKAPIVNNSRGDISSKSVSTFNNRPPVFTRDGKKWLVEYQKGNKGLFIENAEMNNVVYMYRCNDCTLTVKGKINSVVMDSCIKSSIVFDSLVSSIEFVNCQSIQMQVLGKVPTISIDKTDGCQMYLSNESLDVELISSKSSEMNVLVPVGNDYTEYPVPEQFRTKIGTKGLLTTALDSLG